MTKSVNELHWNALTFFLQLLQTNKQTNKQTSKQTNKHINKLPFTWVVNTAAISTIGLYGCICSYA